MGEKKHIIVDSGTSFFLMPKEDREVLLAHLKEERGIVCIDKSIPICYCTDYHYNKFPDLQFTIEGQDYYLPKESYILRENNLCLMEVMTHHTMKIWILGLNFFQNYYTIFD